MWCILVPVSAICVLAGDGHRIKRPGEGFFFFRPADDAGVFPVMAESGLYLGPGDFSFALQMPALVTKEDKGHPCRSWSAGVPVSDGE